MCATLLWFALQALSATDPWPRVASFVAQSTTSIRGAVRNNMDGRPVEDAIVVLQCTCLQKPLETRTSTDGLYRFSELPAGRYTIQVLHGSANVAKIVDVPANTHFRANFSIDPGRSETRRIVVQARPVRGDAASALTLSADESRPIPLGGTDRDFTAVVDAAPSASRDSAGISLAGTTGAESRYEVDGVNVNHPAFGTVGATVVQEFIEEVEVLESGYDAEFGRAAGGQVRARRVSGSNELRGVVLLRYTPRLANPRFILRTDEALRVQQAGDYQVESVAVLSGPIVRDRLFFTFGINPMGQKNGLYQSFYRRIDKDGSGGFEGCPYRNGDKDCVDGARFITTERFAHQKFQTGWFRIAYVGGLDWAVSPKHRLRATTLGGPTFQRTTYRLPFSVDPNSFGTNPAADPVTNGARIATGVINDHFGTTLGNQTVASLEYLGRVANDKVEIDAGVSFAQFRSTEAWRLDNPELKLIPAKQWQDNEGENLFTLLDEDSSLPLAPGVDQACNDAGLPGLSCPVRTWVSGGLGEYDDFRQRTAGGRLHLTHFFTAVGAHQVKYGSSVEHQEVDQVYRYSGNNAADFYDNCPDGIGGGEWCYVDGSYRLSFAPRVNNHRFIVVDTDNPDAHSTRGFGRVRIEERDLRAITSAIGAGARVDGHQATTSTQNYAVFLQDQWAPLSNFYIHAGFRWDIQDMRDLFGRRALLVWDNVAPRLSAVYDWTDEGKSRLYASYGWFFQPIPLQLNNRVFGGLVQVNGGYQERDCRGRSVEIDGRVFSTFENGVPTEWCVDGHGATSGILPGAVTPRLRGPYNQQLQIGYEQEIIEDLVVGVQWLHTDLGRAVEDVSPNAGLDYIVANPGEAVDPAEIRRQEARCQQLEVELVEAAVDDDNRPALVRELNRCEFLVYAYERISTVFDRPSRNYDAWTLRVQKRLSRNWIVLVSYTYSRLIGNYDGFVDPVSGAINIAASTQYDLPDLVRNSFGPLPFDQRHRLKLDGFHTFDLRKAGRFTIGSSLRVASGYPVSMRVDHHGFGYAGSYLVYLLPRGSGGRASPNWQWNLSLGYAYPLPHRIELEVVARLFNVANSKATLRVDEVYSYSSARPIAGGTIADLKHAKIRDPQDAGDFFSAKIVAAQGNYGTPIRFQSPIAAQIEVGMRY